MPNITKRTNKDGSASFRIRVFVGEDSNGKQLYKSKTWTPPAGMRPTTAEKEAAKLAALFEDQVQHGLVAYDGATKFGEYAQRWIENEPLAPKTRARYWELFDRINAALGHIKLEKLQAHHLEAFYKNLAESGVNKSGAFAVSTSLKAYMKKKKVTEPALKEKAEVGITTIQSARRGDKVTLRTAEKISAGLEVPIEKLFTIQKSESGLSEQTIHHHHRLISAVLESAKRQRLVPFNVAREHTKAPKITRKEAAYLTDDQAQTFLQLVLEEKAIRKKAAFVTLLFTGVRLGELCGLTWNEIDEKKLTVHVRRARQYVTRKGNIVVPTKNASSVRSIKVSAFVFEILREYRIWWNKQKLIYGKDWQGNEGYLFIQENGKPIYPGSIWQWLNKFIKQHDFAHISPHSLRHTFATLQIAAGVDIRTLQARTGHSQASTLINIYSHAIESAQEAASDALENMLMPKVK